MVMGSNGPPAGSNLLHKASEFTSQYTEENVLNNKNVLFAVGAGAGGLLSGFLSILLNFHETSLGSWMYTGAVDAALIGSFLVYVQNYYQTKSWTNTNKVLNGVFSGLIIGAIGGFVGLMCVQLFGGGFGRYLGWALSGAAAGYVASLRVPNLQVKVAIIAGAVGGALGCLCTNIGIGYTVGVGATGAVIGLMVALSEQVFRKMSVEVTLKPIGSGLTLAKPHTFSLTLGSKPITVGFSPEMEIVLKRPGIVVEKQIGDIIVISGDAFFIYAKDKKSVKLTEGSSFSIENADIVLKS